MGELETEATLAKKKLIICALIGETKLKPVNVHWPFDDIIKKKNTNSNTAKRITMSIVRKKQMKNWRKPKHLTKNRL